MAKSSVSDQVRVQCNYLSDDKYIKTARSRRLYDSSRIKLILPEWKKYMVCTTSCRVIYMIPLACIDDSCELAM